MQSPLDQRLLGLEPAGDGALRLVLEPHLCRPDGALYGGTAIAAALAAMELVTDRPSLWATAQLVASAQTGDVMDVVVDVLAHGRYIDQARITGSVDGRVVFAAVGSTATGREGGLTGTGPTMPSVAPPEESQPRVSSHRSSWSTGEPGHHRVVQILDAAPTSGVEHEPGRLTMWSRIIDESTTTAAKLGFLADMVPLAICDAAGVAGAGTSLDNSLRVGHLVDCEWVLMDLRGVVAHDGYGHGDVLLWSPDGVLLATGSQTAKLFSFERFFSA